MNTIKSETRADLDQCIVRSNGYFAEYEINFDNSKEILTVKFSRDRNKIIINFDQLDLECFFSDLEYLDQGVYSLKIDFDFSLDECLQLIEQELTEGFLLPNNLFIQGDQE